MQEKLKKTQVVAHCIVFRIHKNILRTENGSKRTILYYIDFALDNAWSLILCQIMITEKSIAVYNRLIGEIEEREKEKTIVVGDWLRTADKIKGESLNVCKSSKFLFQ